MNSMVNLLLVILLCLATSCYGQNLTEECDRDWQRFKNNRLDEWATRMFDSNGKMESGRWDGNLFFEGDYQECLSVNSGVSYPETIKGLFCVSIWYNWWPWYGQKKGMGFCIPHTCTDKDASILINDVRVNTLGPAENTTANTYCMRDPDFSSDPGAIVAVTIVLLFLTIVIAATTFDYFSSLRMHNVHPSSKNSDITSVEANHHDRAQINGTYAGAQNSGYLKNERKVDETDNNCNNGYVNGHANVEVYRKISQDNPEQAETATATSCHELVKQNNLPVTPESSSNAKPEPMQISVKERSTETVNNKRSIPAQLLLSFSVIQNIPRLLRAKSSPGSVRCLNGIRCISMLAVVWGHTYYVGLFSPVAPVVSNRWPSVDMMYTLPMQFIHQLWLVVDTFFLLSGFLVCFSFMKAIEKQKDKVTVRLMVMYYFHRYWRLTPVYMIVLMVYVNCFHYVGNGPFMPRELYDTISCKDIWWRNLLYIQNLWTTDNWNDCFGWAWYLAIDMQLYIMAPPFIILTYFYPVVGIPLMIAGYWGSLTANIVINHQMYFGTKHIDHYIDIYIKPWTRGHVYFIGMLLAVLIYKTKGKLKLPKLAVLAGWVIAMTLFLLTQYLPHLKVCDVPEECAWTRDGEVAWNSLMSTMYSLAISWIIFACINGYGGFVNIFLSWSAWIPFARLCYSAYLVHYIIIMIWVYTTPKQFYVTHYTMQYYFCGHIIFTMLCAFVVSLVFEVPMMGLEKVLLRRK